MSAAASLNTPSVEGVEYHEGRGVWTIKVDIALPCATQNELFIEDAKMLAANGCQIVAEGANMPTTMDATQYLQENGVVFMPGKAANAGGVATSGLEMSQNSERLVWTAEEVDAQLHKMMQNIHKVSAEAVSHAYVTIAHRKLSCFDISNKVYRCVFQLLVSFKLQLSAL